jgi:hypothetical protein
VEKQAVKPDPNFKLVSGDGLITRNIREGIIGIPGKVIDLFRLWKNVPIYRGRAGILRCQGLCQ